MVRAVDTNSQGLPGIFERVQGSVRDLRADHGGRQDARV